MSRLLGLAVGVALVVAVGCGGNGSEEKDKNNPGKDLNAAVKVEQLGPERVVYAADIEGYWDSEKTRPGGEKWKRPPEGREYLKFTYHGDKLTKLETFGETGAPSRWLKAGVRVEWKYAAHSGVLEETGYNEEGEVEEHNSWRYDGRGRMIEEAYGYGGGEVLAKTTYDYLGDSRDPASGETVDGDGNLLSKSVYTYSEDGRERMERYEAYDGNGRVTHSRPSMQRWNADRRSWEELDQ